MPRERIGAAPAAIEVRNPQEFKEAIERISPMTEADQRRAEMARARRREYMHDREKTMAQIAVQVEVARTDKEDAKQELTALEERLELINATVDHLKSAYKGLGRLTNRSAIQEQKHILAGETELLNQARRKLAGAIRYEAGLLTHLENLQRKHAADREQLATEQPRVELAA